MEWSRECTIGKTANYLGLIAKAKDAGYKFIVILSGANNDLDNKHNKELMKTILV